MAGAAPVLGPGHAADEEGHHLVADELVNQGVVREEDVGRNLVEAVEARSEGLRLQRFAHGGRAADVGEEDGKVDFGAAGRKPFEAIRAEIRVHA